MMKLYKIEGMSCGSCVAKVQSALVSLPDVVSAEVDKSTDSVTIESKAFVSLDALQNQLTLKDPKYRIINNNDISLKNNSWFQRYKPILLIFFYILLVTLIAQWLQRDFDLKEWMRHFMAGFFLTFSFFKMLDLSGFADNYKTYDILAKLWSPWGYIYAFLELGLGISYLVGYNPLITNIIAFSVMSLSIIGVLQAVLKKKQIQCACLGTVFDLPMSTVTIIEDALMILMSGYMIFQLIA